MDGGIEVKSSPAVRLQRQIGLHHGVGVVAGLIVGAGIYMTPQGVFENTGSPGLCLVVWAFSGVFEMMGGLCFAELGTLFPESGERYVYLEVMFGPYVAFVYLIMYLFMVRNAANALKLLLLAQSVFKLFNGDCDAPDSSVKLLAVVVAGLLVLLNIVSVKISVNTQTFLTCTSFAGLGLISLTGIAYLIKGNIENLAVGFDGNTGSAFDIAVAFATAGFSYGGWNAMNYLVEEMKNPSINLPLTIIISLLLVTLLYVCTNIAYLSVLTPVEMMASKSVAATFAQKTLGPMSWLITALIVLNVTGSWNSGTMVGSRLSFVAARKGQLPDLFALIHTRFMSPITALLMQFVGQAIFVFWGDFGTILRNVVFINKAFNVLTVIGLLRLRNKSPNLRRPFKVPGIIAILYIVCMLFVMIMQAIRYPKETGYGVFLLACTTVPLYVLLVLPAKLPDFITRALRWLTVGCQKILLCCYQENDESTL